MRNHWNRVIRWMTSKVFKLKGLSEQVKNGYIKEDEERLEAHLAREAKRKLARKLEKRKDWKLKRKQGKK